MPDISLLVDIAEFYDVSIPEIISGERKSEIMNKEEKELARSMSDYATTEKEIIFKEMRLQSIMGLCALILFFVLHETEAYMYNDVLGKITSYCEVLVYTSVILMAGYTTGSIAKLRGKRIKLEVLDSLPKPIRYIVSAVVAIGVAVFIKRFLVYVFGL